MAMITARMPSRSPRAAPSPPISIRRANHPPASPAAAISCIAVPRFPRVARVTRQENRRIDHAKAGSAKLSGQPFGRYELFHSDLLAGAGRSVDSVERPRGALVAAVANRPLQEVDRACARLAREHGIDVSEDTHARITGQHPLQASLRLGCAVGENHHASPSQFSIGQWVKIEGWVGLEEARAEIKQSVERYNASK